MQVEIFCCRPIFSVISRSRYFLCILDRLRVGWVCKIIFPSFRKKKLGNRQYGLILNNTFATFFVCLSNNKNDSIKNTKSVICGSIYQLIEMKETTTEFPIVCKNHLPKACNHKSQLVLKHSKQKYDINFGLCSLIQIQIAMISRQIHIHIRELHDSLVTKPAGYLSFLLALKNMNIWRNLCLNVT